MTITIEYMYEDDCSYITDRTILLDIAIMDIDDHLKEEHDITFLGGFGRVGGRNG